MHRHQKLSQQIIPAQQTAKISLNDDFSICDIINTPAENQNASQFFDSSENSIEIEPLDQVLLNSSQDEVIVEFYSNPTTKKSKVKEALRLIIEANACDDEVEDELSVLLAQIKVELPVIGQNNAQYEAMYRDYEAPGELFSFKYFLLHVMSCKSFLYATPN